jgi:hypothetical protein
MKKIISLLLLVFSASVSDARSIKLAYKHEKEKNLLTLSLTDSKYKNNKHHKILTDGNQVSVSKNKDVLNLLSAILDEIGGKKYLHLWDSTNVLSIYELMAEIEIHMIWEDYQVGRLDDVVVPNISIFTYYFYKQE